MKFQFKATIGDLGHSFTCIIWFSFCSIAMCRRILITHRISTQFQWTDRLKEEEGCSRCTHNGQRAEENTGLPGGTGKFTAHGQNIGNRVSRTIYWHYLYFTSLCGMWRTQRILTSVTSRRPRKKQTEQRPRSSSSRRYPLRNTVGNMSVTEVIRHSRVTNWNTDQWFNAHDKQGI